MQIQLPIKDSLFEGENWLPSPSAFRLFSPALFSVQWVKLDYFSNHLFQEVRKMQMRPFHLSLREDWDRKLWIMLPIHLFLVYTHPNQKLFILVVPFRSWRNSKKKYRSIFRYVQKKKYMQAATQNQTNFLYLRDAPTN